MIEFNDSFSVYGISYIHTQADSNRVEYMKIKQLVNGAPTYYEETNYPYFNQYSRDNSYKGYQRGTFGRYFVRNLDQFKLGFYGLV